MAPLFYQRILHYTVPMKKLTVVFIFLLIITIGAFADEPFFASQKGMVLTTASTNARGRIEGFTRMVIGDVKNSENNKTIFYTMELLDRNQRPTGKAGIREYNVTINTGVLEFELINMMDIYFASREMNYELRSGKLKIPSNMTNGTTIEDSWMYMAFRIPVIGEVTAYTTMTNIRCVGIETITVPAGTFEAFKVTTTSSTETSGFGRAAIVNTSYTWYTKGIGVVKSVNMDDKGKIESSTELYELIR